MSLFILKLCCWFFVWAHVWDRKSLVVETKGVRSSTPFGSSSRFQRGPTDQSPDKIQCQFSKDFHIRESWQRLCFPLEVWGKIPHGSWLMQVKRNRKTLCTFLVSIFCSNFTRGYVKNFPTAVSTSATHKLWGLDPLQILVRLFHKKHWKEDSNLKKQEST